MVDQKLIEAALAVQKQAYAPYSNFLVGAAIRDCSGKIYCGCNFENASYGLAICAERCAVGCMVASGQREIQAVVVASRGGVTPCGACRQVLAEFGKDFTVTLVDSKTSLVTAHWTMLDLLPGAFSLI